MIWSEQRHAGLTALLAPGLVCDGSGSEAPRSGRADAASPGSAAEAGSGGMEPERGPGETTAIRWPPDNPFLADSPWPITHRNSYAQASSPLPGPADPEGLRVNVAAAPLSVSLPMGPAKTPGDFPVRGCELFEGHIYTVRQDSSGLRFGQRTERQVTSAGLVGAYAMVDRDGIYDSPTGQRIDTFLLNDAGQTKFQNSLRLDKAARGSLVGMNLTFDGLIAFATADSSVGVARRDFGAQQILQLQDGGAVSNSIAIDEDGGIYVVTDQSMNRVQWTGETLSLDPDTGAWSAPFVLGGDLVTSWLGQGSGSTPSLMGT